MNDSVRFYVWKTNSQEDYEGEFDKLALQSYLANLPISAQEVNGFYQTILSDEDKKHTLYINNSVKITVAWAKPFTSNDQFMSLIWDMYYYNLWSDEMIRNIIDEAAGLNSQTEAFELLDRLLPSEIPREFIDKLPFLQKG